MPNESDLYPMQIENVCYQYDEDDVAAVDHVSLNVEKGSFVAVLGHNGSGKSTLAQRLAAALSGDAPRYYWATMTPHDDEDRARIRRHVADRAGMGFVTVERSLDLPGGLAEIDPNGTVLFDSITACLSERMFPDGTPNACAGREITGELLTVSRSCGHLIAVCDDLWHGGEDYQDWTEVYVRELAEICRALASEFDAVCEMTAGLPRLWKGELPRV